MAKLRLFTSIEGNTTTSTMSFKTYLSEPSEEAPGLVSIPEANVVNNKKTKYGHLQLSGSILSANPTINSQGHLLISGTKAEQNSITINSEGHLIVSN